MNTRQAQTPRFGQEPRGQAQPADDPQASPFGSESRAPAVALPKGGGAIRGIGEKLAANPVTGAGSMSLPIATSTGRSGFGPQLALTYDSSAGNCAFGFGWGLSLPCITRKTDKGLPQYRDAVDSDIFVLSGAEDLVPLLVQNTQGAWVRENPPIRKVGAMTYRVDRYRPRVEGLFARVERWANTVDATDVFWRSISRDNVTTWYGKSAESRIADPGDASRIFSWLISWSHDDRGNVTVYGYKAEDSAGVLRAKPHERNRTEASRSAQRYLKYIRYGNSSPYSPVLEAEVAWPEPPGTYAPDGSADWRFEAVFDYGEHDPDLPTPHDTGAWPVRPDPFSSYRAGFEVRTYRICRRVLMFHHFPGEAGVERDCLVRSTDFTYSDEIDPLDHRVAVYTCLRAAGQTGYRRNDHGYQKRSLPPVEFEYSQPVVQDTLLEVDPQDLANLPIGLDGDAYRWIDLHGEGIPGILTEQAGAWFYKRNLSPLREKAGFAPLETVALKPNVAAGAEFVDLAGDGRPDVVVMDGPAPGLFEHDEAEGWLPFRPFTSRLNRNLRDPHLRLVDLDGDGRADVLLCDEEDLVWHHSLAEEGFGAARRVAQPLDEEAGPRVVFADGTRSIHLADLSGDGLTDIVQIRNGSVCYWPNLGHGRFGAKVTMDNAPCFDQPEQFDHRRLRLADIDGSGTTDIIYLHRDGVRLYFNQSGNGWSRPQALNVFPRIDDLVRVTAVDLLGNGTACLVWSPSGLGETRAPMRYVNLMGDRKPHLLIRACNNLGTETRVEYASSTKFYLQDRRDGRPWVTRLPFPVHVVERVETRDYIGRSRFSTRYAYHHGYFDGHEREFRGFAMVEQWDTEEFSALAGGAALAHNHEAASHVPPVRTKTWFHTGARLPRGSGGAEYFREPGLTEAQARDLLLPEAAFPAGLAAQEEREACRALKGSMLRQEVYAADAGPEATAEQIRRASTPYTVIEQNFGIRTLQPRGTNQHAVFLTHAHETVSYHYERNPADPRVQHVLNLEVDGHGNVLKEAVVGYGRRGMIRVVDGEGGVQLSPNPGLAGLHPADQAKQTTSLVTYTEARFTNAVDGADAHRKPLPCEARSFELTGYTPTGKGGRFQVTDFVEPDPAAPGQVRHRFTAPEVAYEAAAAGERRRRPIDWRRTLYRRDDLEDLSPLGELHTLALPGETYQLAFTAGLLAHVFQRPQRDLPAEPLLPDPSAVLAGAGYLRSQELKTDGRFPTADPDDCWWIPSGRIFYASDPTESAATELTRAKRHFFVPRRYRDAFGQNAFTDFDSHDMLITETLDAMGNRTTVAANDYRVLQPRLVSDPNGNQTEIAFDSLGLVAGVAVMGKPLPAAAEGDTLAGFASDLTQAELDLFFEAADPHTVAPSLLRDATTRNVYDVGRFHRTRLANPQDPAAWQPACAATLTRETHVSEPLPPQGLRIQLSFSHSDGFGRQIQSKVQAEPGRLDPLDPQAPIVNPRWVCSGWTIFNNKGKPVRQYEPFFSATHDFQFGVLAGVSPVAFYDPAERVMAVLHPNHTFEKVVFDPWRQKAYDANDTCAPRDTQTGDPRTDTDIGGYVAGYFEAQPSTWQTWHAQRIGGALGEDERNAALRAQAHADTPTTVHFDTLGRTFMTTAHNRVECPGHDLDGTEGGVATRVELDIEGNQRAVRDAVEQAGDPLGRVVTRYAYDMAGNAIHQLSMEAGARWTLADAAGAPVRVWDSRGHTFTTTYDTLRRPAVKTVRGATADSDPRTLNRDVTVEVFVYGEGVANAEALNLRTRVYRHLDSAGVVTNASLDADDNPVEAYDFKGNLLRSTRRFVSDHTAVADWLQNPALQAEAFESRTRYDALNRPAQFVAPHSNLPRATRNVIQLEFNGANLTERVHVWLEQATEPPGLLDPAADPPSPAGVANIDYDARGQRIRLDYKNGAHTLYTYDPLTHRLTGLLTRRGTTAFPGDDPVPPVTGWPGRNVQNLHYTFDPAGNITHIRDSAQQTVYFRNRRVEPSNDYLYDAVYRLIQAEGREHLGQAGAPTPHGADDAGRIGLLHRGDGNAMGRYVERYLYDPAGNLHQMRHHGTDPAHAGWVRGYQYAEASLIEQPKTGNRLSQTTVSGGALPQAETYRYDAHGNLLRLPHLGGDPATPNMHWDYQNRLRQMDLGGGGTAHYVYDASGQRMRKVWEKAPGLTEERLYIGGFEVFRRHSGPAGEDTARLERETLQIIDGEHRIALVQTLTLDTAGDDPSPRRLIRYQFGNHLGSTSLELDDQAQVISYEEYTPYGSSSYQAVRSQTETPKRYRYTGMERDDESGLSYHGARYYAAWLGRWASCDPIGVEGGINLYEYAASAPISFQDPTGTNPQPPPTVKEQAAIAEDAGKAALVKKYSGIATVVDVTPAKDVSANGVDAHLIVGKGNQAVNVIADTKFAGPDKHGKLAPENYTGKEKAGHVSSFDTAAKNNYGQLVRNIRAALKAGKIDPATAHHAIQGAKMGLVAHEIVVSGRTTGVSAAIKQRYQALVTPVDNFAESTAKRQSLDIKASLGKTPSKVPSVATLTGQWAKMLGLGKVATPPSTPPANGSPTVKPPGVVKLYGGMPGTMTMDPAPRTVGGVGVAVLTTVGPDVAVKIAEKAGASEPVVEQVGLWSSVLAGGVTGAVIGAPAEGVGAIPGFVIGSVIGGVGYVSKNYEFCVPFYNCSD